MHSLKPLARWPTAIGWRAKMPRKNPHATKKQARRMLRTAIKNGSVLRHPCETCGATAQAHHSNYDEPLNVRWLCPKHHMVLHLTQMPRPAGELNGQAFITAEQVRELRARYLAGRKSTARYARGRITQRELATEYGISQAQVFRILQGTRWVHV